MTFRSSCTIALLACSTQLAAASLHAVAGRSPSDAPAVSARSFSAADLLVADAGTAAAGVGTAAAGAKSSEVVVVRLAVEGQSFKVFGTMPVAYGAGAAWTSRSISGDGSCTAAFFGVAPSLGERRSCRTEVPSSQATDGTAPAIGLPAGEGGTFFVYGKRSVVYGIAGASVRKDVTGRADCSNAFFGSDPAPGVVKSCSFAPSGATLLAAASQLPKVDAAKIPAPAVGFATERVKAANVADPSQNPSPSDIGDFREYCEYSHMSYDDPIVAPGSVGAHLHVFLGNTGTNGKSTPGSIAGSGNSTCAGGTLNRSAYWVPAVIDTTDGTPQAPLGSLIYYKQGYNYIPAATIRPFPAGLRIVAGNAASSGPQDKENFTCTKADGSWRTSDFLPTDCPAGATLTIGVAFPQCWDGVNLDAPDHKSHMAYPNIGCPATHPVPLTGITFVINYKVGASGTGRWRLSSDNYDASMPGGYSSHADWYNGWNPDVMNVWTTRCINAQMDCHAFLIGDGRVLY